jgi:hypothetical protein
MKPTKDSVFSAMLIGAFILNLAIMFAVGWVAWHFISKWW